MIIKVFFPVFIYYDGITTGSCPFICHSKGFSRHYGKKAEFLVIYPKKNCFELDHYVVKLIRNPAIVNKMFFEINIAPCLIRKLFILVSVT